MSLVKFCGNDMASVEHYDQFYLSHGFGARVSFSIFPRAETSHYDISKICDKHPNGVKLFRLRYSFFDICNVIRCNSYKVTIINKLFGKK